MAGKKETVQYFRSILKQCNCSLWTSVSILKQKAGVEAGDCKILATPAFKGSMNYVKLKEFRKDRTLGPQYGAKISGHVGRLLDCE